MELLLALINLTFILLGKKGLQMKVKVLLVLLPIFIIISGCASLQPKPFKLDINVNFTTDDMTVSVVDGEGNLIASKNLKIRSEQWQKSQALCFQ